MADLSPTADYDSATDTQILDLFQKVKQAWAPRDDDIAAAVALRNQEWTVEVPKAWKQTAKQHHTSRAKEIPQRIVGTLMLNDPIYSRPNPGFDFDVGVAQNQVERFLQAYLRYWDRRSMKSRSGLEVIYDSLVGKGGACVGSLLMPQSWAGAPLFTNADGKIVQQHWRDSRGKPTDQESEIDLEASARAFMSAVDGHRQTVATNKVSGMPLKRRILPPEQCYPVIVEDQMLVLFVERKVSMLELEAGGWQVELGPSDKAGNTSNFVEVHTPNRSRYYMNRKPVTHPEYGEEGLVTNNGFVPYVYQTSLSAGETDYGAWGLPVLGLVDSNIRTIDTLRTYLMNAVHLASFTSFYIEYVGEDKSVGSLIDSKSGKRLTTFEFKSGTIMDFGPGRKVVPLTHPGLNADFWKALAEEEKDVDVIIPRTLSGTPASSGYNTVVSSVQGRTLYNSLYRAAELLLEQVAEHDLRLLDRLPGPVYLEYEMPSNSARDKKYERVKISPDLIAGYYGISVSIDRTVDPITEGTFRANMNAQGVGDLEWVSEGAGIVDYEDSVKRRSRDRVLNSPEMMAVIDQSAIDWFGMRKQQERAVAMQRLQQQPDGTMAVTTRDGRTAAPGQGISGPQNQGAMGAQGGANNNPAPQSSGGPNLAATHNPNITQPTAATANRGRLRRRGGATPGAPQRQPYRPTPANPSV